MADQISTRKVPLRSVCRDGDTLAAIRFTVEHVATPFRARLLDFLRHFSIVCRTDASGFRCATCAVEWKRECGLEQRRDGLRQQAAGRGTPEQEEKLNRRVPDIDTNFLVCRANLRVATPTRQQTCVTRWWRCYWVTRGLLRCAAVVAAAALAQGQEAVLAQGQAAAAAQGQAARGQAAAAARVTAPSVYLTPQASTSCPVHI